MLVKFFSDTDRSNFVYDLQDGNIPYEETPEGILVDEAPGLEDLILENQGEANGG